MNHRTSTTAYIGEVLSDAGRFVYEVALVIAQWLLDMVGVGASPEALVGLVLLVVALRILL